MQKKYDALVLFSGGLDSLLTAKILEEQGLEILCLHYHTPFFGSPEKISHWKKVWNLNIIPLDVGEEFCEMLLNHPPHGYGSTINPCVDCKILILSHAKNLLSTYGASFLATGEVLGQRPMSQRRDSLDLIRNAADVRDFLLRPLCAKHLLPTPMEESGLVDREKLYAINGRGRNEQLELAKKFNLKDIPSPAGGCALTEKESGRRYWQVIKRARNKGIAGIDLLKDFSLSCIGRQFWLTAEDERYWLCIGRNRNDNRLLLEHTDRGDLTLKIRGFSGPIGLARGGEEWDMQYLRKASAILASYSTAAVNSGSEVEVSLLGKTKEIILKVLPEKNDASFFLPSWESCREEIKWERKNFGI